MHMAVMNGVSSAVVKSATNWVNIDGNLHILWQVSSNIDNRTSATRHGYLHIFIWQRICMRRRNRKCRHKKERQGALSIDHEFFPAVERDIMSCK